MQRSVLSTILTLFTITAASAGPVNLVPETYRAGDAPRGAQSPAAAYASAPVQRVAQGPGAGGGFLQMLFGGGGAGSPRYEPPRRPEERGGYASRDPGDLVPGYEMERGDAYPSRPGINPRFLPQEVSYDSREKAGTIIINTQEKYLYLVKDDGRAMRYGIGVGRPGFTWSGVRQVSNKREWPDWTPPPEMIKRRPDLPRHMVGGPDNPLGARAMYLGSSLYRIHGSNEPWTIGTQVSSGCIRMRNEDVIDLYSQVKVGTKVVVI